MYFSCMLFSDFVTCLTRQFTRAIFTIKEFVREYNMELWEKTVLFLFCQKVTLKPWNEIKTYLNMICVLTSSASPTTA